MLNQTEAVYGFASWLTTRDEVVKFGSTCDCAIIADLVRTFCLENGLPQVSENWPNELKFPKE